MIKYYCIRVSYVANKKSFTNVFPQRYKTYEEAINALAICMKRNIQYAFNKNFAIIGEDEQRRYVYNLGK